MEKELCSTTSQIQYLERPASIQSGLPHTAEEEEPDSELAVRQTPEVESCENGQQQLDKNFPSVIGLQPVRMFGADSSQLESMSTVTQDQCEDSAQQAQSVDSDNLCPTSVAQPQQVEPGTSSTLMFTTPQSIMSFSQTSSAASFVNIGDRVVLVDSNDTTNSRLTKDGGGSNSQVMLGSSEPTSSVSVFEKHNSYHVIKSELVELNTSDVAALVQDMKETGDFSVENGMTDGAEVRETDLAASAGGSSSRWRRAETLKLIELYKEYQKYFDDSHYKKKTVWTMLATKLAKACKSKARYTSTQVCSRWKNLTKLYRDSLADLAQYGPWVTKCQYFDEIDTVYRSRLDVGVAPRCPRPLLRKRLLQRQAKRAKMVSGAGNFVAIAPKGPASTLNLGPSGSSDVSSIVVVTEKTEESDHSKTFADVVEAVKELHEDQKRADAWKLDRLERMHKEKIQMFTQFLDILKQCKQ